jgi:HEAT repeat protein
VPEAFYPELDQRVQALGLLIETDAPKVLPMLRNIALEQTNLSAARGAVFVLAQSRNPQAYRIVIDVAKQAPVPVQIVAVRELGRFGGEDASKELLHVYSQVRPPVKQQVVTSLSERADTAALFSIAQSENDPALRVGAIVALGRAGGREYLRVLYPKVTMETRRAVIRGLFSARDDEGLIRIAEEEKDPDLRRDVRSKLGLIGTPRAKAYLAKESK